MKYGYPGEMHEIQTKDGYILTLHRIPHNGTNLNANRPVVLLQHGIVLSSDQWVLRGTQDLVFQLSKQGYDVWMSNTRDELGNIDLPAIIDYVLQVTKKSHLTYVGHSRGVAMAVILLSSQPEYNSKINLFVGIAPVIYSKEAKCIIYEFAGNRPNAIMRVSTLQEIFRKGKVRNVLSTTKTTRLMINSLCKTSPILQNLCLSMSFFINGEDFQMFNKSLMPMMLSHFTLGVGGKELIHLLQISESDVFRPFDYGRQLNIKYYGKTMPEPYNLTKITTPVFLYYGPNDFFVSERDLFKFARELPNFIGYYKIPYNKFNHIDYIFANNANDLFFPHIIHLLNLYNNEEKYFIQ
ncbi:Lipase 1 precursor, putative [Pediculus humanus corporis]|uniref:Lipase 1, putative n=1 Tax=Pediculus humanus subsp. corporis TaxID=121224 RepID=E0V9B8_PEDHC|nr:Lipase 1 precursor, putative [Pediculus humanus corporis]EEB09974.1 Lipase 1 precursor, putative [Pediculus humanus corporis]